MLYEGPMITRPSGVGLFIHHDLSLPSKPFAPCLLYARTSSRCPTSSVLYFTENPHELLNPEMIDAKLLSNGANIELDGKRIALTYALIDTLAGLETAYSSSE